MSSFLFDGMGDKLKKVRKAMNLTQKEFAEEIGVKQSYYSLMEAEKAGVPLHKAPILFSNLGVSERWFLSVDGTISDDYMFDKSIDQYLGRPIEDFDKEKKANEAKYKIENLENLIKEKDQRINELRDLVTTKDQLIELLQGEIERLKSSKN